jgi:hypothetical protein
MTYNHTWIGSIQRGIRDLSCFRYCVNEQALHSIELLGNYPFDLNS